MNITAKHIQRSNIVVTFADGALRLPEAAQMFALYTGEAAKGSVFSDTPSMATRVFEFPVPGLQWIFEPDRIRIEDKSIRSPKESSLAQELHRVISALYPDRKPAAYGFNYDMIYRMDVVIPTQEIMKSFVKPVFLEEVASFGWQYTLTKDKGKRTQTYFFKAVSPIEYSVHANFHYNDPTLPKSADLQTAFERAYADADESLTHMKFS
ncbi:MAG: hypothetical protein RLY66_579 [Candidatus Parcubacteria bacterium]|jgi:hypothetical protein